MRPVADYASILKVLNDAGVNVTDIMSTLTAHSDEAIYYRIDHHWTSLGAYYAYCAWRDTEPAADEWTKEALCNNFRGTTWNKVPLPSVPAEEITAWYKHANRRVSYNNGEYETDREEVKLLLIKDSYGNTFAQFPVEDYAEVHVIDLRFFRDDIVEYAKANGITDALILYGVQNFVKNTKLS